MTRRVLVCGGRDYNDRGLVNRVLDIIHPTTVVHGAASGADDLADSWATQHGVEVETFPAEWGAHGRPAGPIRNAAMVATAPDLVVAFPGGRGTADLVRKARAASLLVLRVEP